MTYGGAATAMYLACYIGELELSVTRLDRFQFLLQGAIWHSHPEDIPPELCLGE
jgi:hypothetical protein